MLTGGKGNGAAQQEPAGVEKGQADYLQDLLFSSDGPHPPPQLLEQEQQWGKAAGQADAAANHALAASPPRGEGQPSHRPPIVQTSNLAPYDKGPLSNTLPTVMEGHMLSGRTGTLIYMSPEVFRNLPYNEKVSHLVRSLLCKIWQYQQLTLSCSACDSA